MTEARVFEKEKRKEKELYLNLWNLLKNLTISFNLNSGWGRSLYGNKRKEGTTIE